MPRCEHPIDNDIPLVLNVDPDGRGGSKTWLLQADVDLIGCPLCGLLVFDRRTSEWRRVRIRTRVVIV